jgi:hypothetical protein
MRKRRPPITPVSEEILHRHVAKHLDVVIKPPWFWSTIPAGGGGRIRGARLKAMGLKRGMPDLIIFGPGGKVLGIELKREGGSQSPEQKVMAQMFADCGCWYVLCRSVEEVQRAVHFVQRRDAA